MSMLDLAVLVPVYKADLDELEHYSLDQSLRVLKKRIIFFIAPENLDIAYYRKHFPGVPFIYFAPDSFASIVGYNRLLLSTAFYSRFVDYEFVLILQTDAIILRDELDDWTQSPFDYVGAPWPAGLDLFVHLDRFGGDYGRKIHVTVGNGGLSLRRTSKCIALINEFPVAVDVFNRTGSSEDLFFAYMGALSTKFIIPNEIVASHFSMELNPDYYLAVNGGQVPMGGHAWWKSAPEFWARHLPASPLLDRYHTLNQVATSSGLSKE
jgi:hypothetical protein